jgi:signal peptidase I
MSQDVAMRRVSCLALVAAVAGCAPSRGGHIYRVPSASMEPTLHCARPAPLCEATEDDLVYAVPYSDDRPQRGDIVVFRTPPAARDKCGAGGTFIKRVIGLPGERWSERRGAILIDGRPLSEPWLGNVARDDLTLGGGSIPPARYLLLGDNRRASCDSRVWGPVRLANIRGRVVEIKRGSERIHLR